MLACKIVHTSSVIAEESVLYSLFVGEALFPEIKRASGHVAREHGWERLVFVFHKRINTSVVHTEYIRGYDRSPVYAYRKFRK